MATLKFKVSEFATLLEKLEKINPKAEVQLVGDQGVYLMSFADEEKPRTIVYAEGCNPNGSGDWYENKRRLFGGDDGCDPIGTVDQLLPPTRTALANKRKFVVIKLSALSLSVNI